MSLPPDAPQPSKPKMTPEERRAKTTARLRVTIDRELENRGTTDPKAIGEAIGLPASEATKLLSRTRRGDHTPTELLTGGSRGWPALG